nr:mediator of DNA damage checkpoint protein 1-like isoform X4 [Lytechinus pictus]
MHLRKTRASSAPVSKGKGSETEVRSYAVGVAAKWGIQVLTLEDLKWLISKHKSIVSSQQISRRAKRTAPSHQLKENYIKLEDKSKSFQPVVKRPSTWPRPDFSASTGSPFTTDAFSPPRTRSAGRKTNARKPPAPRGSTSPQKKTRQPRQVAATKRSVPPSPVKPSPRGRSPRVTRATKGPIVTFQLAKIPPASEVIPKPKPLKKANVTMRKVKRQLDFDDVIIPSPVSTAKTKIMKATKKLVILKELQDRLDGITDLSPVKSPASRRQQPARGKRGSTSPRPVTVSRLARQLKKELHQTSPEIAPMSLRNGKIKFAAC